MESANATAELDALIAEALPVFEAAGDNLALRIAYRAIGESANMRAQADQLAAAYEQALSYGGPAGLTALVGYQSHGRFHGSTPLTELLAWQDEQDPREQRSHWLRLTGAARSRCSVVPTRRARCTPSCAPSWWNGAVQRRC